MLGGPVHSDMDETPAPPRGGGAGRWVIILIVLAAGGVWAMNYFGPGPDPAFSAEADGKPVMLMFTADWCGPCQRFKATVLSEPRVLDRLGRSCGFRTVDLTNWNGPAAERAKRYGVRAVPTLILVNSRGREISRYAGPHDPQSFGSWIDQNTK